MSKAKRQREAFTPKDRSVITKACLHGESHEWAGRVGGFPARIAYCKELPSGKQVHWAVAEAEDGHCAATATVFDALQEIESAIAKIRAGAVA